MATTDYQLLTSTRYDTQLLDMDWNTRVNDGSPSPFMLLPYHLDRLIDAVTQHGWTECLSTLTLDRLTFTCDEAIRAASEYHSEEPFKVRVLLSRGAALSAAASPCKPFDAPDPLSPSQSPEHIRTIYVDTLPTHSSIFTATKTTHRDDYNAARARIGLTPIPTPSDAHIDVLLYTPDGLLTETSIRNIAFYRGGRWITPHAKNTGCLSGVMRRLLIEEGKLAVAKEGELRKWDLEEGELVMTANSVEGCCMGRIAFYTG